MGEIKLHELESSELDLSVVEIAARVGAGQLRATDLTQRYLERIEKFDGKLGSYLTVDNKGALEQAARIDQRVKKGEMLGPLAGVPIALKDLFVTRGLRTTCAARILEQWVPPFDGAHAERLRAADAVILGKLNMDEFAMGASTENSGLKPCRNPWNHDHVPGGSSGGSAAAVAARLCACALGSDTGGSIRQPAAFCGVVGVKPTYGRVSRYGMVAFASSLDQAGPLASRVEDAARLLQIVAGFDERDATSLEEPLEDLEDACKHAIKGTRLGIPPQTAFGEGVDPEAQTAVDNALERLKQLGAQVVEISLPHVEYAIATYYVICTAEASSNLARFDGVRYGYRAKDGDGLLGMYQKTRREGFGDEVKRRIMLGTFALSAGYYDAYYARAQRVRTLIRQDFQRAFADCDVIVTPTSPFPAFRLGERCKSPMEMYMADLFTCPANLAGLPGMSLPCGFTASGLPLGMQLVAPPLAERRLFALGGAFQRETDWHLRRPPINAAKGDGA